MKGPCIACGKKHGDMCSRCRAVFYCSKDCQKADWKAHKYVCIPAESDVVAHFEEKPLADAGITADDVEPWQLQMRRCAKTVDDADNLADYVQSPLIELGTSTDPTMKLSHAIKNMCVRGSAPAQDEWRILPKTEYPRVRTLLEAGADPNKVVLRCASENECRRLQAVWRDRERGASGLVKCLRKSISAFPSFIQMCEKACDVELLRFVMQHTRVPVQAHVHFAAMNEAPGSRQRRDAATATLQIDNLLCGQVLLPRQAACGRGALGDHSVAMVDLLLQLGARADLPARLMCSPGTVARYSPLHVLCNSCIHHMEDEEADMPHAVAIMRALVKAGADINELNVNGYTPLISIARNIALSTKARPGLLLLLQTALELGADVRVRTVSPLPPLRVVDVIGMDGARHGKRAQESPSLPAALQMLYDAGADFTPVPMLHMCASCTRYEHYLMDPVGYQTPLHLVHFALTAAKVDPNLRTYDLAVGGVSGNPLFYSAARMGAIESARVLLAAGADPLLQSPSRPAEQSLSSPMSFIFLPVMVYQQNGNWMGDRWFKSSIEDKPIPTYAECLELLRLMRQAVADSGRTFVPVSLEQDEGEEEAHDDKQRHEYMTAIIIRAVDALLAEDVAQAETWFRRLQAYADSAED